MNLRNKNSLMSLVIMAVIALGYAFAFFSTVEPIELQREPAAKSEAQLKSVTFSEQKKSRKLERRSWLSRLSLRKIQYRDTDHLAEVAADKSTSEKIFNSKFVQQMKQQYKAIVGGAEKVAENPYRRASPHDQAIYQEQRRAFSDWLAKEIVADQVKQIFSHADRDSAGMKMVNGLRSVTGGESMGRTTVISSNATTAQSASEVGAPKEEPRIPTRLRTKLNLIRGAGSLQFQNPVVSTNVNVDMRKPEDRVELDMNKEISPITLKSQAKYAMDTQKVSLQLNKKITDELNCSVSTERYTGSKTATNGARSAQTLQMNYSIGF